MKHISHKMLGLFIAILTLATLGTFANHELEDFTHPMWLRLLVNYFPYFFVMIVGPTAYYHCKMVFYRDYKLTQRDKLSFLPALLELVPFVGWLILMLGVALNWVSIPENGIFKSLQFYQRSMEIPRILSLMVYMYLTWKLLKKNSGEKGKESFEWVRIMVTFGGGIISLFFVNVVIFFSPLHPLVKQYQFEVYTIYYPIVGFIYLLTSRLVFQKSPWYLKSYEVSEMDQKANVILRYVELEKVYQNPNLKIGDIAKGTGIPSKAISHIFNQHFEKGFNAFINEFRVKEAMRMMTESDLDRITIEGIATSVGFASRSTFYRAFKLHTNQLPSDFIHSLKKEEPA